MEGVSMSEAKAVASRQDTGGGYIEILSCGHVGAWFTGMQPQIKTVVLRPCQDCKFKMDNTKRGYSSMKKAVSK